MTTTDNGADQLACRNHLNLEFSTKPCLDSQIFIGLPCMKHQYHLIAKSHLQLCDVYARKLGRAWKYFSAVATLCHVWRGHLAKVQETWRQQHQHEEGYLAQPATNKIPPLAVAGRWASVDGTLVLIIGLGKTHVRVGALISTMVPTQSGSHGFISYVVFPPACDFKWYGQASQ